jgi:4-amino-4-deoxy-L-arabinose transferase-like glycosyltransferase
MSRARALALRWWGAVPIAIAIALFALRACLAVEPRARLAHDGTGSLYIARAGPVIVGFTSGDGPARLRVGDRELRGAGLVKERIVLPAGPIAIRFEGPPDARLVWSPVGRRGDPEYVPASSLSPDPPARATFGDDAGATPLDGWIALALLATLAASLCMLARRRLARVPRAQWIAMAAIFVAACAVRWIDLSGFGQTWDEDVNWAAGRNYVTNVLSLDFSTRSWSWNYEHPPVMKYLAGAAAQLSNGFGPARALSAVWIALACALLVPIGARLYRLRVGVLAGAIAALLPPLVAHGQIVGHESPTALAWTIAIAIALGVDDEPVTPRGRIARLVALGAAVGVAASERFVDGLVGPACVAIVLARRPWSWRRAALVAGIALAAALVTFYALWPRLWLHPIDSLRASLHKLDTQHALRPYLGDVTNAPDASYFVVYLAATLPIGALAGALAWIVRSVRQHDRAALVTAIFVVAPLGVMLSPVRQDGVRYVIPSVVALAVASAAGWDYVASALERRWKPAFFALASAVVVYLAIVLARVHPYYLDYYGEQVGGAGTAAARGWFATAWWGEGVDRAVDYVNAHAAPGARVYRGCIEPNHLAWFRGDLWADVPPAAAEWFVVYAPDIRRRVYPQPCPLGDATKVFEVAVDGAVLAEVYRADRAR